MATADMTPVTEDTRRIVDDLAALMFADDPDVELAILCEGARRVCPEQAIERTVDMLIDLGRHSAASVLPSSEVLQ